MELSNEPLFAYGTLKRDEIAFNCISAYVDHISPGELSGYEIGIRDGLPVIFENTETSVKGEIIFPKKEYSNEFWRIINDYEESDLYQLKNLEVQSKNGSHRCGIYVGKREKARGYFKLDNPEWMTKYDPYFAYSFPLLFDEINKIEKESYPADMYKQYWFYMNSLQEKYLLLTVILEHIALLVIGTHSSTGPNARINQLGQTSEWKQAFNKVKGTLGVTKIIVKDAKKLKDKFDNESPENAIKAYYQVRSNLSHQGKSGGFEDCELMYFCLKDLSILIKEYLLLKVPNLQDEWNKLAII